MERPVLVILCWFAAVCSGLIAPLLTWVNGMVLDLGLEVAAGSFVFSSFLPYLLVFALCLLLPQFVDTLVWAYIKPASQLILRTSYTGKMLQKLKVMRYEHMEAESSIEIIEKAFGRAEEAALHIFPVYFFRFFSSFISAAGILYLFASVRWWLIFTILIPFALDTYLTAKNKFNIYEEMETYWNQEHQYAVLGNILKSREFIKENQLYQSSSYLIDTYKKRLNSRNKEFERYYFLNLKKHFFAQNIAKIAQLSNAILLFLLYVSGGMEIGQLIAMTMAVFSTLWASLDNFGSVFKWIGHHIKASDYYEKYFTLSEDSFGTIDSIPEDFSVEFEDVCFTYPGTEKQVISNLSFYINGGEKVAIVGQNGEGKSTIVKLLLGLFNPDTGCIRVGGIPLSNYSRSARESLFAPVFQDFNKYSISLKENVGIGDIEHLENMQRIKIAMKQAKVTEFLDHLPNGMNTILGRDFEGGVDISGGQWQRVAIARAFMGNKPILILDEPTSQLDPMAESEIYSDFAEITKNKTAIFITHRLGATTITDRIIVLSEGKIVQSGSHKQLISQDGLYAQMFNSQKQWYTAHSKEGENA